MKCRDCENLIWGYDEGERIWQCRERYCPDLDIDRECPDFALKKPDIFTTLSTLQAENLNLQAQKVRWFQIHKTQEKQIDDLEAENEKLRAELEQLRPARGAVRRKK